MLVVATTTDWPFGIVGKGGRYKRMINMEGAHFSMFVSIDMDA